MMLLNQEPHMVQPVVHRNLDGPNGNESSSDSSPDEDDINMERNQEYGLVSIISLYFAFSIKHYSMDLKFLYLCLPWLHV